jgi:hypothetical protein
MSVYGLHPFAKLLRQSATPNSRVMPIHTVNLKDLFGHIDTYARKLHGGLILTVTGCFATPVWHS